MVIWKKRSNSLMLIHFCDSITVYRINVLRRIKLSSIVNRIALCAFLYVILILLLRKVILFFSWLSVKLHFTQCSSVVSAFMQIIFHLFRNYCNSALTVICLSQLYQLWRYFKIKNIKKKSLCLLFLKKEWSI